MYNHAPENYQCPFCLIASGGNTQNHTIQDDVVYQDDKVIAWVSSRSWPDTHGNVIIVPKEHHENLYDLPDQLVSHIHVLAKRIAIAMKLGYQCDGTSTRQHNEPAGYQDVFHFHLHVFPRSNDDNLYLRTNDFEDTTAEERKPFVDKLKDSLKIVLKTQPMP